MLGYDELIKKVGGSNFSLDEKMFINAALKDKFDRETVAAAGFAKIASMAADEETYSKISQIISSAKERTDSNKPALTAADKKVLEKLLGQKVIRAIETGDSIFFSILQEQMASRQSVSKEIGALTGLLEKQDAKTKNKQ